MGVGAPLEAGDGGRGESGGIAVFLGPAYSLDPGFLRSVVPPHEENARVTG